MNSKGQTAVIDNGHFLTLLNTLEKDGINRIHKLIISHADKDHIAGVATLLACEQIQVDEIYLNPDTTKSRDPNSEWNRVRLAIEDAKANAALKVIPSLSVDSPGEIAVGDIILEVLSPTSEIALSGAGYVLPDGSKAVSSNTMSAVLRLKQERQNLVLFAADFDQVAFGAMAKEHSSLEAKLLVFPHHGGLPRSGDPAEFTRRVLNACAPSIVYFSNGRKAFANPNQDIVSVINDYPGIRVICSQLAKACAETLPNKEEHLQDLPARGRSEMLCCGGSIRIQLDSLTRDDFSDYEGHRDFISEDVASPMCSVT